MGERESVTDLLKKLRESDSHESRLVEHFFEQARRYAEKKINQSLRSRISPTDIALTAVRNCLVQGKHGKITDSQQFQALLITIVNRKVASAVAALNTDKRDISREVPAQADNGDQVRREPVGLQDSKTLAPEEQAALKELSQKAIHHIWEEEEKLRFIGVLGLLVGYSAGQIQEVMTPIYEQENPPQKCPAVRTINVFLKGLRERLGRHLEEGA